MRPFTIRTGIGSLSGSERSRFMKIWPGALAMPLQRPQAEALTQAPPMRMTREWSS
jgi:hypothetical protein